MTDEQQINDDVEAIEDLIDDRVRRAMESREVSAMVIDPYEAMRRQRVRDQQLAKELQMDYAPHGGVYRIGAQWYDANGNVLQDNQARQMSVDRTISIGEDGEMTAHADFLGDKTITTRRGRRK